VLLKCIKEEEPNEDLFDVIYHAFLTLDQGESAPNCFHLGFLAQLMNHLGFQPSGRFSEETAFFDLQEGQFVGEAPVTGKYLEPEEAGTFALLCFSPMDELGEISLSSNERQLLLERLLLYCELHIEGFGRLKSPEILRSVLH
jgi:DNA repair protein RecO (recombination protein O)